MSDQSTPKRQMPKGVRKGGARYPRYPLSDAVGWATKLVAKTHTGPQPRDVVFTSVLGSNGTPGEIKGSALKQYGLMEGDSKAYSATTLARDLAAAPPDERPKLLAAAALSPAIFKGLFDTYHGDETTRAKLRQRAAALNVHPEETEKCVDLYVSSLAMAGLVSVDGDRVSHVQSSAKSDVGPSAEIEADPEEADGPAGDGADVDGTDDANSTPDREAQGEIRSAVFNVNVTLDSSLDTDKLERQLKLLKRYGVIK